MAGKRRGRRPAKGRTPGLEWRGSLAEFAEHISISSHERLLFLDIDPRGFLRPDPETSELLADIGVSEGKDELKALVRDATPVEAVIYSSARDMPSLAAQALEGAVQQFRHRLPRELPAMTSTAIEANLSDLRLALARIAEILAQPNAASALNMGAIFAEMETTEHAPGESTSSMPSSFPTDPTDWLAAAVSRGLAWVGEATREDAEPGFVPQGEFVAAVASRADNEALRELAANIAAIYEQATGYKATVTNPTDKGGGPGGPAVRLIQHALCRATPDLHPSSAANIARTVLLAARADTASVTWRPFAPAK